MDFETGRDGGGVVMYWRGGGGEGRSLVLFGSVWFGLFLVWLGWWRAGMRVLAVKSDAKGDINIEDLLTQEAEKGEQQGGISVCFFSSILSI